MPIRGISLTPGSKHLGWIIWNFFLLVPLAVFVLCSYLGFLKPGMTGFYCDDRTIQRPFTGDTITMWNLAFVVLAFPLMGITLVEYLHTVPSVPSHPVWWRRTLTIVYKYILGLLLLMVVLELLKTTVGELRPHFFDTCRPNITVEKCSGEFVSNYVCTNINATRIQIIDSRKSFPSGHSAGACFASLFLAIYVHIRMDWDPWLLRPWLQTMFIAWAAFCSVSRVTDFRHHWWDVLFGAAVGLSGAVYTVIFLCNKFKKEELVSPSNGKISKAEMRCATSARSGCVPKDNSCSSTV